MGFIAWLTEPIRDSYRLAARDVAVDSRGVALPPTTIEADTFSKLEEHRLAAVAHRRRSLLVGLPAVGAVAGLTFWIYQLRGADGPDSALRAVIALVLGGLAVRLLANIGFWIFSQTAKHRVLSVLAGQQNLEYNLTGVNKHETKPFEQHGLFGSKTNGGDTEDAFRGVIDGVEFLLFEALRMHYSRSTNGGGSSQVFHGLCLRLSFPKRFSGITRVLSDHDALNKLHEMDSDVSLERVRLEDPTFEEHFEAVSSDQVEARYLLTPGLMERLVDVQTVLGERTQLRAAFHDRHLLITLDTRKNRLLRARILRGTLHKLHHFEIKDTSRPVDQMNLTRQFERELAVIKALVETLNLNMKTRV